MGGGGGGVTLLRHVLANWSLSWKYPFPKGDYPLTENSGNSGWKVNGKVTFRKFQPKIEEYVLR